MKGEAKQRRLALTYGATRYLVGILQRWNYTCAVRGDIACHAYGDSRVPKVVDVVILGSPVPKLKIGQLKLRIVESTPADRDVAHFYVEGDNSGMLKMFYRDSSIPGAKKKTCPVELAYCIGDQEYKGLPVEFNRRIRVIDGIPFVPLSHLLLQKLHSWGWISSQATAARDSVRRAVRDMEMILFLIQNQPDSAHSILDLKTLPQKSIYRYSEQFPRSSSVWRKLGFDVGGNAQQDSLQRPSTPVSPPFPPLTNSTSDLTPHSDDSSLDEPSPYEFGIDAIRISNPTRIQMLMIAAATAMEIMASMKIHCAFFGSLACFLYGNLRSPNDVDVLALPPPGYTLTPEDVKDEMIQVAPDRFFALPAKDPQANYKVLYYQLPKTMVRTPRTSCKVDIVFPGTLGLPNLPLDAIWWDEGLPLVPFPLLLLQKLQGWHDHVHSSEELKRLRQDIDAWDVQGLLQLSEVQQLQKQQPWSDRRLFSEDFQTRSRERVREYVVRYPDWIPQWATLGF